MKIKNIVDIREQNLIRLYRQLYNDKESSRNKLSVKTQLSLMTISNLVDILLSKEVVEETKHKGKSAGRTPLVLKIKQNSHYALIIDITSYDFKYFIVNMNYEVVDQLTYNYNKTLNLEKNLDKFFKLTGQSISNEINNKIIGVGFSAANEYNKETDSIECNSIPELSSVKLMNVITKYFKQPVFIGEDIKLAAKAILYKRSLKDLVYVFIGDGIGSGIVINGDILMGYNGLAGELGQLMLENKTLEEEIGFITFTSKVIKNFPDINKSNMNTKTLKLLQNQEPAFIKFFDEVCIKLAKGLSAIIYLLDPKIIIMEGEYHYLGEAFIEKIKKELMQHYSIKNIPEIQWDDTSIKIQNSIMGAAIMAIEDFINS
jgi:predicted NBD/HSP70 family sugar kinase